jgi:hypothetical protein
LYHKLKIFVKSLLEKVVSDLQPRVSAKKDRIKSQNNLWNKIYIGWTYARERVEDSRKDQL